MKKVFCLLAVALLVSTTQISVAAGLLPSLFDTVGIAMPSLGEALQRYPDEETENADGSITELYFNVSEGDFNAYSVYLKQQGAELLDYIVEKGVLSAEILAKGASFDVYYDSKNGEVRVTYPSGTYDEWTRNAKSHFEAALKLFDEGKTAEAYEEIFEIQQFKAYGPVNHFLSENTNYDEPSADIYFISFTTQKCGKIILHGKESVIGMKVKIIEPILGLKVAEYELTAEEIAADEFQIPKINSGNIYMEHMDQYNAIYAFPEELELHVTVRYNSAEGEKTLEYSTTDKPEQGWGMLYWADDEEATDWSYPGYFRFSTYESTIPVSLVINEPDRVTTTSEKIVISVSLSIDGRQILPEECEIREEDADAEYYDPGETVPHYYFAYVFLKRPEWAGEHGTIHMTVTQQLVTDGSIWTSEEDMDY